MLLLIDQKKIDAQLAEKPVAYTVTACNLETPAMPYDVPSVDVNSAVTAMPPELQRARERLLSVRQSLLKRGIRPLSPEELDRNINETRGRS